jgi:hypothetical protein
VNIAELHAGPTQLELALSDVEQLGKSLCATYRDFSAWRRADADYHLEVCGCEGDACGLGERLLAYSRIDAYLDPTTASSREERRAA